MTRDADPTVRDGDADDYRAVMNVLDGAMLDVDAKRVRAGLAGGEGDGADDAVLVAELDGSVVGALVLDGGRVTAVAVRRSRRDRGVGTALVEAAVARRGRVTATFDARVRPFYESLGFQIRPVGGGVSGGGDDESEERGRYEGELRRGG